LFQRNLIASFELAIHTQFPAPRCFSHKWPTRFSTSRNVTEHGVMKWYQVAFVQRCGLRNLHHKQGWSVLSCAGQDVGQLGCSGRWPPAKQSSTGRCCLSLLYIAYRQVEQKENTVNVKLQPFTSNQVHLRLPTINTAFVMFLFRSTRSMVAQRALLSSRGCIATASVHSLYCVMRRWRLSACRLFRARYSRDHRNSTRPPRRPWTFPTWA